MDEQTRTEIIDAILLLRDVLLEENAVIARLKAEALLNLFERMEEARNGPI